MKRAVVIPLPVLAILMLCILAMANALPLNAQHGHAGGGGGFHSGGGSVHAGGGFSGGGFASHSAPPSRGGFGSFNGARGMRPVGPSHFGAPTHIQPGRPYFPSSNLRSGAPGSLRLNPGARRPEYNARGSQYSGRRPDYGDRDHHHHPHRPAYNYGGATYYTGSILPYGLYNPYWNGYGDLGFSYGDSYDDNSTAYANPAYDDDNNYVGESAPEAAYPQDGPQSPDQPNSPYNYGSPQAPSSTTQPAAPPLPQESVTLVFNNGAPSQQIHNYILSRNILTILDGPRREIPIADLDLAATQKANRAVGIDFHLPAASQ